MFGSDGYRNQSCNEYCSFFYNGRIKYRQLFKMDGGCHLNRDIPQLIKEAGFVMEELNTRYIPGPKIASYHYWGVARII